MSTISAGTTTGTALVSAGDTTGNLVLQTNGTTTALTLNTAQALGVGVSPSFGTSGQALLSAGSGAAPAWGNVQAPLVSGTNIKTINGGSVLGSGDLVIGGGMTLLATITPTAAANVDFLNTFSSTYDCYLITCTGVTPASYTSSPGPLIRVATGGVVDTTSLYNGFFQSASNAASSAQLNTNQTNFGSYSFQLFVANANTTSNVKYMTMQLQYSPNGSANDPTGLFYTGAYRGTSAISGLRIYWSNGTNFTATGSIRVYGYNNT
jgi:hypothetical protein